MKNRKVYRVMRCFQYTKPQEYVDIRITHGTSSQDRRAILRVASLLNYNTSIQNNKIDYDSYILLYQDKRGVIVTNNGEPSCVALDVYGNRLPERGYIGGCRSMDGIVYYGCSLQYLRTVQVIIPSADDIDKAVYDPSAPSQAERIPYPDIPDLRQHVDLIEHEIRESHKNIYKHL